MALISAGAAIASGLIGAASSIGSSLLQWGESRNLQEHSADLQRSLRQTQYQDTIADMKKAGINPGALQGSSVLGSSSGIGSPGGFVPQIDNSLITSILKQSTLSDKDSRDKFKKNLNSAIASENKWSNFLNSAVLNKDYVVDENGRIWPIR